MADDAQNFRFTQVRFWEAGKHSNAVTRAQRSGAKPLCPWPHDGYINIPGDDPAQVWVFPDGSVCVIGDNGGWIYKAHPQYKRMAAIARAKEGA